MHLVGQWPAGFESRLVPDLPFPFIPTLIGLRVFDLVSSPVWWEAATNILTHIRMSRKWAPNIHHPVSSFPFQFVRFTKFQSYFQLFIRWVSLVVVHERRIFEVCEFKSWWNLKNKHCWLVCLMAYQPLQVI